MKTVIREKEFCVDNKRINKAVYYSDGTMSTVFVRNVESFKEKVKYDIKPEEKKEEVKTEEIKKEVLQKVADKTIKNVEKKKESE